MTALSSIEVLSGYIPKLGKCEAKFTRGNLYSDIKAFVDGRRMGAETYTILSDTIHGNYISTEEAFQGKGVGGFLRAASIVEMLTYGGGKIKNFIIESRPSAKGFHEKFGFKPYIKNYDVAKGLNTLRADRRFLYQTERLKAEELFKQGKIEELQNLINRYMESLKNSNLTSMKLSREDILKNSEFYNNFFTKNGIDFRI